MEKIYYYPRFREDEPNKLYRFQCDCLSPDDAMDIFVEADGKDSEKKYFTISMNFEGYSFWNRLKYAWQILRGWWSYREFCVRENDHKSLSDIFNPNKKFSELP